MIWRSAGARWLIPRCSQKEHHPVQRFYHWHTDDFPIPRREIEVNSANMHMVPASADVERVLNSVKPGQHITFSGYLIEARGPDGWRWKSSLTREDTGAGACELVWVEKIAAC